MTLAADPAMTSALLTINLPNLTRTFSGKVREIYNTSSKDYLLVVATDRMSVFDVRDVSDIFQFIAVAVGHSLES